jgi:hypothetical protein
MNDDKLFEIKDETDQKRKKGKMDEGW